MESVPWKRGLLSSSCSLLVLQPVLGMEEDEEEDSLETGSARRLMPSWSSFLSFVGLPRFCSLSFSAGSRNPTG